jgi:thioredoxin reductase (NADPH)
MNNTIEVAIIGSGPAGMTAAIYAARAGLKVAIFAGPSPFGQLMYTSEVENFPGCGMISGQKLMENMKEQAVGFGVEFLTKKVDGLFLGDGQFTLRSNGLDYKATTCILATGSEAKWLGLASEKKFQGRGISTCATCDGFFYKDKVVAVIGGGNTALEEALFLSKLASKVVILHRRDTFRGEKILQERVLAQKNIEILWNSEVHEFYGQDEVLNAILVYNNETKELSKMEVSGVFIAIGHTPQTDLVRGILELDSSGYVKRGPKTKVTGLFVAGDVQDYIYRQAVTAAADGCKAALEAVKFLESGEKSCITPPKTARDDYKGMFKVESKPFSRPAREFTVLRQPRRESAERDESRSERPRGEFNERRERRSDFGDRKPREGSSDRRPREASGERRGGFSRDRRSESAGPRRPREGFGDRKPREGSSDRRPREASGERRGGFSRDRRSSGESKFPRPRSSSPRPAGRSPSRKPR